MRQRILHLVVLSWLCAWFGVVAPGHQRGAIRLPGATPTAATGMSCCAGRLVCETPGPDGRQRKLPPPNSRSCAICHIIATLTVPPPLDFVPQCTELALLSNWLTADQIDRDAPWRQLAGRAPPAAVHI